MNQPYPEQDLKKTLQLLEKGKFKKGEELMDNILETYPDFLSARLSYADFLLKRERSFEGFQLLKEVEEEFSDNSDFRYLIGVARQKCWLLNLAQKDFEFLRKGRSTNQSEVTRQLGWTKVLRGEIEEGRKLLREAIDSNLTSPWPYVDLGTSYAMILDFESAFQWMETAQKLAPNDDFIQEKIEFTKNMEKDFQKFSKKERETMREMRRDPKELKITAAENLVSLIKDQSLSQQDSEEIQEELKLSGFDSKSVEFSSPETEDEKVHAEYIKYHQKVPDVERKISDQEFEEIKKKILNPQTEEEELKKLLLILAHQGKKEVVSFLEEYSQKAPSSLTEWVKLALEECRAFSQTGPSDTVKIIHRDSKS